MILLTEAIRQRAKQLEYEGLRQWIHSMSLALKYHRVIILLLVINDYLTAVSLYRSVQ